MLIGRQTKDSNMISKFVQDDVHWRSIHAICTKPFFLRPSCVLRNAAFSLAEVLITLAIIGVVASISIPILMANYQKEQYVAGLKKAYSIFGQATTQMASDFGCVGDLACTGLFAGGSTHEALGDELVKYLNVTKNCRFSNGCWAPVTTYLDGTPMASPFLESDGRYKFILADGMTVNIENMTLWPGYLPDCGTSDSCFRLVVDVNGAKPPNRLYRDTFLLFAKKNAKLVEAGGSGVSQNSWQMNY